MKKPDVSPDAAYWTVIVVLLGTSLFFAGSVEMRRKSWQAKPADVAKSGAAVGVKQVIDGDEVSVQPKDGEAFVVRLVGIKAFDPGVNDPALLAVGDAAVHALEDLAKEIPEWTVVYDEPAFDDAGRLLAYLDAGGADVGERLLAEGHAIAFVRYPHAREERYRAVEQKAEADTTGLWGMPRAAERARALRDQWRAERGQ